MNTFNATDYSALRQSAGRVREAFANYLGGTGRDAREIAEALPAILDELERLRGGVVPAEVAGTAPSLNATALAALTAIDTHAHRRAQELLTFRSEVAPINQMLETAFCLGYKTGVVDAGQALALPREGATRGA